MTIQNLFARIEYTLRSGSLSEEVSGISRDNRKASAGDVFICTAGARFDTHDAAVLQGLFDQGVKVFVVEKEVEAPEGSTVVLVKSTRETGAFLYAAWFGNPADRLTTIGITGSKGKTTTTHMLADMLNASGHKAGTIGTNGAIWNGIVHELSNTTPESNEVQSYLKQMADDGCDTVVVEVSSQGMKQHRVDGFTFDYGIWMNISEDDHIGPNEHESFEDYLRCKAELINHSKLGFVHVDDPHISMLLPLLKVPYETFGAKEDADYTASAIEKKFDEIQGVPGISFAAGGKLSGDFFINLPGDFNTWNALAALAVGAHMNLPYEEEKEALASLHIKGRTDIVYKGRFSVCVDFAHNGVSTFHHLAALREFHPKRLVCIFGADGNRSKDRRYGMGEAAGKLADFSIVTSGHNRWETFEAILADTEVGLHKAEHPNYIAIKDRKEAIRYAIENAEDGDLITIIGLGHETWQEEMGVKYPHSDTEFVKQVLRENGLINE